MDELKGEGDTSTTVLRLDGELHSAVTTGKAFSENFQSRNKTASCLSQDQKISLTLDYLYS